MRSGEYVGPWRQGTSGESIAQRSDCQRTFEGGASYGRWRETGFQRRASHAPRQRAYRMIQGPAPVSGPTLQLTGKMASAMRASACPA